MKRQKTFLALIITLFFFMVSQAQADIISPAPGTSIDSSTVTFEWEEVPGATQYWLFVGSEPFNNDIYSQSQGTNTSVTVNVGTKSMYYVSLIHYKSGWNYTRYIYTGGQEESPACELVGPPEHSVLSTPATFTWNQIDSDVTMQYLKVSSAVGQYVAYEYVIPTYQEYTVELPEDGGVLFVQVSCYSSSKGWTHTPTFTYTAPY